MDVARLLEAIFSELVEEIDHNPKLRVRITKLVQEHMISLIATSSEAAVIRPAQRRNKRQPGPFDPMVVYSQEPDALGKRLNDLAVEELKDIIAEQGMDRTKLAMKWTNKERLVELIVSSVRTRAQKGDAFSRESGKPHGPSPAEEAPGKKAEKAPPLPENKALREPE